jgi:hypothetical protein
MATATTTAFIPNIIDVVISYGLIESCCFTTLQERAATRFVMCLEESLPSATTNLQNISGNGMLALASVSCHVFGCDN